MPRRSQYPHASWYTDRHGKRRWRYRHKGFSAELGTEWGSEDFIRRYQEAEAARKSHGIGQDRTRPGSFDALLVRWYRSPGYVNLADSTKRTYRGILERFREQHGRKRVAHLERRHLLRIQADKVDTPAAANNLIRLLRLVLDHAIELGWRADNPARGIKPFATDPAGWHTWSEAEIAAFYAHHPLGSTAHLAMTLMLYTGAARSDAVRLGWGNVSDGRISYRRRKTRRRSEVVVDIPVHPRLAEALATVPKGAFTFLQTTRGKSRSPNGLGTAMRRWCDAAGLPECSSHGLRKAIARRLAEAGATPHMIQSVTGHATLKEVDRYTAKAGRAALADAGFDLLEGAKPEQKLTNLPKRFAKNSRKSLKGKEK